LGGVVKKIRGRPRTPTAAERCPAAKRRPNRLPKNEDLFLKNKLPILGSILTNFGRIFGEASS